MITPDHASLGPARISDGEVRKRASQAPSLIGSRCHQCASIGCSLGAAAWRCPIAWTGALPAGRGIRGRDLKEREAMSLPVLRRHLPPVETQMRYAFCMTRHIVRSEVRMAGTFETATGASNSSEGAPDLTLCGLQVPAAANDGTAATECPECFRDPSARQNSGRVVLP